MCLLPARPLGGRAVQARLPPLSCARAQPAPRQPGSSTPATACNALLRSSRAPPPPQGMEQDHLIELSLRHADKSKIAQIKAVALSKAKQKVRAAGWLAAVGGRRAGTQVKCTLVTAALRVHPRWNALVPKLPCGPRAAHRRWCDSAPPSRRAAGAPPRQAPRRPPQAGAEGVSASRAGLTPAAPAARRPQPRSSLSPPSAAPHYSTLPPPPMCHSFCIPLYHLPPVLRGRTRMRRRVRRGTAGAAPAPPRRRARRPAAPPLLLSIVMPLIFPLRSPCATPPLARHR